LGTTNSQDLIIKNRNIQAAKFNGADSSFMVGNPSGSVPNYIKLRPNNLVGTGRPEIELNHGGYFGKFGIGAFGSFDIESATDTTKIKSLVTSINGLLTTGSSGTTFGANASFTGSRLLLRGFAGNSTAANLEIGDGASIYWRFKRDGGNEFVMDHTGRLGITGQFLCVGDTNAFATPSARFKVVSTTKGAISSPVQTSTQRNTMATGFRESLTQTLGSGYTNGSYSVSFTGGTGTGATANITITAGSVSGVIITAPGSGYTLGDVLTATGMGPGSGFSATITSLTADKGLSVYNSTDSTIDYWNGKEWSQFGNKIVVPKTITPIGTTGDQTINTVSGTVNIAASGTSVTITNSKINSNSIIHTVLRTNDATAWIKNVVASPGSATINLGAASTGVVSIGFTIID